MPPPSSQKPEAPRSSPIRVGRRLVQYALAFVTVILIIDAVVGDKGLLSLIKARREYAAVDQALRQARRENAELREEARRLREDPSAIEELARRELGLIKPGEKLFIVRDAAPARK